MLLPILIDLAIFLLTALAFLDCFRVPEGGWSAARGLAALRFFTVLSNLFSGFTSLLMAFALFGQVPRWLWLLKYVSTHTVTVTLLTVLFFLGPTMGYRVLLSGRDLYLHLIGPLMAIVSFCFLEKKGMPPGTALLGMLPVVLYGSVYLYKVVLSPQDKRWEDFYGFNKDGKWPIALAAMLAGTLIVCLLFRAVPG